MPPLTRLRLDAVLLCEAFLGVPLGDRPARLWLHGGRVDPGHQLSGKAVGELDCLRAMPFKAPPVWCP